MAKPWIATTVMLLVTLITVAGCATTEPQVTKSKGDYNTLCYLLSKKQQDPITKEEFVAAAKNKEEAEKVFLLCEPSKDQILTKDEFDTLKPELKQQVIRLVSPR